ncbi:MAG: flagellar hook-length control protein FliK [Syntrophaceticus sp.]
MDPMLLPLIQPKVIINNSSMVCKDAEREDSCSFMQLLGVLLKSEQNLAGGQPTANTEIVLPVDKGDLSLCITPDDENHSEEIPLQLSVAQMPGCVLQLSPGEEVELFSQANTITQLGTEERLQYHLPANSGNNSSDQVTILPNGEPPDLTCSLQSLQEEITTAPKTGALYVQQVESAQVNTDKKTNFSFIQPKWQDNNLLSQANAGRLQDNNLLSRANVSRLLEEHKAPDLKINENMELPVKTDTLAQFETNESEVKLLSVAPEVNQQEVDGMVVNRQIAEDSRLIMVNNDKTALKIDIQPKEIMDHLASQIIDKANLFVMGKDHADLKLKLKPEFLGHLRLNIQVVKGVIHAHFIAENPLTAGLIETHLHDLRQSLEQHGISWQQLGVSVDGEQVSHGFTKQNESNCSYQEMIGRGDINTGEELQKQEAVGWQPGSINYLI